MAKKYIAVRRGHVNNVVFVCTGENQCKWFDHVWPLIEGTSHQEFKDSIPSPMHNNTSVRNLSPLAS